jgi:hypothetical protein
MALTSLRRASSQSDSTQSSLQESSLVARFRRKRFQRHGEHESRPAESRREPAREPARKARARRPTCSCEVLSRRCVRRVDFLQRKRMQTNAPPCAKAQLRSRSQLLVERPLEAKEPGTAQGKHDSGPAHSTALSWGAARAAGHGPVHGIPLSWGAARAAGHGPVHGIQVCLLERIRRLQHAACPRHAVRGDVTPLRERVARHGVILVDVLVEPQYSRLTVDYRG